jgi:hypothetical protein
MNPDAALIASHPPNPPVARHVWTAVVDIGETTALGPGPLGDRFIVPILGGAFYGAPGFEGLSGAILPGGADRQLIRPDGIKELDALYEMRSDHGHVLTIRNRVVIDNDRQPQRYALSNVVVTAPEGPHAWLNRRILAGTLAPAMPIRQAVIIRVWVLDV